MDIITHWIEENLHIAPSLQEKLLYSLIILLGIWVSRVILLWAVRRRNNDDIALNYRWRKTIEYVTLIIGLLLIGRVWIYNIGSAATYLGLLSAGLAIALQDPITNFFGWIFIITRHPFEVGDRIGIGGDAGDVVDIRYFQFSVMEIGNWVNADQSTGRVLHIPNRKVFNETLANYTRGFDYIWNEIPVLITFESNRQKTMVILQEIIEKHANDLVVNAREGVRKASRRYMIFYQNLTPIVYLNVEASGVMLTMRYLCDPRQRRGSAHRIWDDVLTAFDAQDDIHLAYPTQRIYYRPGEEEVSTSPL